MGVADANDSVSMRGLQIFLDRRSALKFIRNITLLAHALFLLACVPTTETQAPSAPPVAPLVTIDDYVRATERATTHAEFLALNRAWIDGCFAKQKSYPLSQKADALRACRNQVERINAVAYRKGLAEPKRILTAEERRRADAVRAQADQSLRAITQATDKPAACGKPGTNDYVIAVGRGLC